MQSYQYVLNLKKKNIALSLQLEIYLENGNRDDTKIQ